MNFQITLLNYKLDFQNKNIGFFKLKKKKKKKPSLHTLQLIYKNTIFFKFKKKKASSHARSACDEASIYTLVSKHVCCTCSEAIIFFLSKC